MMKNMNRGKDLEKDACEKFVCPNMSLIDEKGKDLQLKDSTIEKAKELAIEYFKMTYHKPIYTSVRCLLPAFTYIATIIEKDKRSQWDIELVYGVTCATIRKWSKRITKTLGITIENGDLIMIKSAYLKRNPRTLQEMSQMVIH